MKRTIFVVILCLLLCHATYGENKIVGATLQGAIAGGGASGAAASCNTGTDTIGITSPGALTTSSTANTLACQIFTPVCTSGCTSGNLSAAYLSHHGTSADVATVCVYSDDGDSIPNIGDLRIGCSSEISSSTDGENATVAISGAITCANKYWVCMHSDATAWDFHYSSGGANAAWFLAKVYSAGTGPANLDGTWTGSTLLRAKYVTIGP